MSPNRPPESNPGDCGLLRVLALATLGMVLLSWPLWVSGGEIPCVPFVQGMPRPPVILSWGLLGLFVVSIGLTGTLARSRPWFWVSFAIATVLVLQDQHRFQPWLYLYAVVGILLTSLPPTAAMKYTRWWYVSLYVHSGLSKLDCSFVDELGAVFLTTLGRLIGLEVAHWSESWRTAAILAMPVIEIVTGLLLLAPKFRWIGLAGATILHLGLIVILGPFGLGHSTIVLVWNALMLVEVWIAFGSTYAMSSETTSTKAARLLGWFVKLGFWSAVILPFGERWGVFDAWPAHALYASHVERVGVYVHTSESENYPASVRQHLTPSDDGLWLRLDLTGWSRRVRGTPVYPESRACLGLAEGLAARYGFRGLVRVVVSGPADRWTGLRTQSEHIGIEAIRREASRFRINAHPARAEESKAFIRLPRSSGLLLHPTSLPSRFGIGDLGPAAHEFVALLGDRPTLVANPPARTNGLRQFPLPVVLLLRRQHAPHQSRTACRGRLDLTKRLGRVPRSSRRSG